MPQGLTLDDVELEKTKALDASDVEFEQPKTLSANELLAKQGLGPASTPTYKPVQPQEVPRLGVDVDPAQAKNVSDALGESYSGLAEAPAAASGIKGYPKMAHAVKQYVRANVNNDDLSLEERNKLTTQSGSEFVQGAGEAATPLLGAGLIAAPVRTAIGLGTGLATSYGAGKVAQEVGASPETQEFAKDVGFFAPSVLGAASGLHTADIPPNEAGVTGKTAEMFGGRVKGAAVSGPRGKGVGVKVGNTSFAVGAEPSATEVSQQNTLSEGVQAMVQANEVDVQAARVANGQPPVPPPPKPPIVNDQQVKARAEQIKNLPPEAQPEAIAQSHQELSKLLSDQGVHVNGDGTVEPVTSPKAASKVAADIINKEAENEKPSSSSQPVAAEAQGAQAQPEPKESSHSAAQGESELEQARRGAGEPQAEELPVNQVPVEQRPSTTIPLEENARMAARLDSRNLEQGDTVQLPSGDTGKVAYIPASGKRIPVTLENGKTKWTMRDAVTPVSELKPEEVELADNARQSIAQAGMEDLNAKKGNKAEDYAEYHPSKQPVHTFNAPGLGSTITRPAGELQSPADVLKIVKAKFAEEGKSMPAELQAKLDQLQPEDVQVLASEPEPSGVASQGVEHGNLHRSREVPASQPRIASASERPAPVAQEARTSAGNGSGEVAPGQVGELETRLIHQAPHRFQYKLNTDSEGVGTLLKEQSYKPELAGVVSVWRDPADGRFYVTNGHHRVELAKRSGQPKVNVLHIVAKNEEEARASGALQNIAEGRGTPVDAAKFIRDSHLDLDKLKAKGISMAESTASKGVALSKLDDSIFSKVVQGDFPIERAVAIGEATDNHAEQKAIADLIDRQERKGKKVSNDTLRELVRFVKGSGQSEETTASLFGAETVQKSHALEKAEVSAYIKQQLAKDKKLFGFVSKGERAEELERGNNIIDVKTSKALAEEATQGEEVYNKLSERAGPISDILDDAAARLAGGENANAVKQEAYSDIKSELAQTLGGSAGPRAQEREGAARREFSLGGQEETAGYRQRQPNSELSDSQLSSWSKSRSLRISDGGKQNSLFGGDEPMYKLTRLDSDGQPEHTLVSQAQFDSLRKEFPNFDKAARAFEQGVEPAGVQTSMFDTSKPEKTKAKDELMASLFSSHAGIPVDAIPAAAKYVSETIKNSDPAQNLKDLIADESAKIDQSRDIQKGLYDLEGAYAADVLRAVKFFKSIPGTPIDQAVIYHNLEDPDVKLSAGQEQLKGLLTPLVSENERIYKKLSSGGVPVENYVHRVVEGKGNFIDRLLSGSKGGPGNILSKRAGATKSRSMMSLEDADGNRKLVSVKDGNVNIVQRGVNGESIYKPAGKIETKDGERVVSLNGKLWNLKQATTKEIEAGTDLRYYKNAAASTITSYLELRKAERAYDFLESLKSDPKFQDFAWTKGKDGTNAPPKGWKPTKLTQFQGYYFEPHQAEVFDWYWDRIHHDVNAWDKLGRVMMTSIFYNPLLHVPNVGAQWLTEGGTQRFVPSNVKNAWKSGDRAMKAVRDLNDDYIEALRAGAPLMAYRPEADQLQKMFFDHLGDEMQKDSKFAAQMKEMFGSNWNPYALSHKITWGSNDVLLLQSIYEHMGKGDSMKDAIKKATEIIPDYRLPTRIFDSAAATKILSNRGVTMFMPYHYGVLKSAAKMAAGAAKGDKDAYGRLIALALLTYVLYPAIDKGVKKLSGNQNARMKRSGVAGLVDNIQQVIQGHKSPTQALQSVITPALHTKTAIELGFNRDLYTGNQVYDPHAPAGKIAKQIGRKLAGTIGPADQALRAYDNKHDARKKAAWAQVGVTFPNPNARPHR